MTSAPNHLQLLSGNSLLFLLLIVFTSCAASKSTTSGKQTQIIKAEATVNPKVKKDTLIPSPEKKVIKVDTIIWQDISKTKKPIDDKNTGQEDHLKGIDFKAVYNIKLLMPLNSDSNADPANSRFVHFYAGAIKAFGTLSDEGIKLNVKVIDTEEGDFKMNEKLSEIVESETDLIIGPFEREDLRLLAEACKANKIPLVSPWQTSTKLTIENPYYIQMKPNLKEHFLKLAENTSSTYQAGEVAIIGKNNKDTNAWIKYFQEAATSSTNVKDFYVPYFVTNDSLNSGPTAFYQLFSNTKIKAIIIPNYSFTDEDFIYACLRKLSAEKGNRQISVFGMPILFESDKVDFDFYNALQIKIVMSDFVDENQGKIREFRRDYLDLYGEIANADAVKGYDLILYLGRNIWKYGKNFQNYLQNEATAYLQSTYDIRKAKSDDSTISNLDGFDYYENKHLDIIEFKNNKWQRRY